jgi:hypothetical protein
MYQLITNCQGKSCIRLSGKDLPQRGRGRGEKQGGKGSRGGEEDARRVKRSVEIAITAEGRQSGGVPPQSKTGFARIKANAALCPDKYSSQKGLGQKCRPLRHPPPCEEVRRVSTITAKKQVQVRANVKKKNLMRERKEWFYSSWSRHTRMQMYQ